MASWKFTDDYGKRFPALGASVLALLDFSEHSLTGTAFTGTLDVAASGAALATFGQILGLTSIAVSGQVTEANNTLTVSLTSADGAAFLKGIAASIPLIAKNLTGAAMSILTVV